MAMEVSREKAVLLCNPQVGRRENDGRLFLRNSELRAFQQALSYVAQHLEANPDMALFMSYDHPFAHRPDRLAPPVLTSDLLKPNVDTSDGRCWFVLDDLLGELSDVYISGLGEIGLSGSRVTVMPEQSLRSVMSTVLEEGDYSSFVPHSYRTLYSVDQNGELTPGCIAIAAGALNILARSNIVDGRHLEQRSQFREVNVFWQYSGKRTDDTLIDEAMRFLTEKNGLNLDPTLFKNFKVR